MNMDRTTRLFASLHVLGLNPKMETFTERKQVQKLAYLLDKVFGMNFNFSYNWYLHGPYSPEVTEKVFGVLEGREMMHPDLDVLQEPDLKKIEQLKSFLGNDINSSDKLELLVSVHFLMQYLRDSDFVLEDLIAFLKAKKPYFTDKDILDAIDRLRTLKKS